MKYKLRNTYTTDVNKALSEILIDRGVENLQQFLSPSFACELNPYKLNNIQQGVDLLLKHLRADNKILIIVDSDTDGVCSASILWLYIKKLFE